ncbi:MAG: sodium-dependent transporter [Acidiferrobacterales bacterium]|nr:sodium-dependent transporter [Acidiferrobacterales bacterium]
MTENRAEFSSKIAFILAASGSAIGLGNIWGFPIQVAQNGGGAFVVTYLILTFLLAYPILMTELIIGRHAKKDIVSSMQQISSPNAKVMATVSGYWGILTASLILSFYAIVAGWMIAYGLAGIAEIFGINNISQWFKEFSLTRNLIFVVLFYFLTVRIVAKGVASGIEKWTSRLMPMLLLLIVILIIYVATQEGASDGWKMYLQPDFGQVLNQELILSALGQAFFSLSLGVGTMMIYGSYVNRSENIAKLGASVAVFDVAIAFLAGLLVIPAMTVALFNGVEIYNDAGKLIDSDGLIFSVLPALFDKLGFAGAIISVLFFSLMTIAALTSSISMLEVPVAYAVERRGLTRSRATNLVGGVILLVSVLIIFNFSALFGLVISFTTKYSEPIIGFLFCLFAGWVWNRQEILSEIKQGMPDAEHSLFWKIWPNYIKFVCPLIMCLLFWHTMF